MWMINCYWYEKSQKIVCIWCFIVGCSIDRSIEESEFQNQTITEIHQDLCYQVAVRGMLYMVVVN